MNDLEISKALALAIGWEIVDSAFYGDAVVVGTGAGWRRFDYTDWRVIGPIAAKYDCFPYKNSAGVWVCTLGGYHKPWPFHAGDTPQKAIAMAVIERSKT